MDTLDNSIIELLKEDAKASFISIGKKLGTSEGTIRARVARLIRDGTIRQFTVRTSGFGVKALMDISIDRNVNTSEVSQKIASISGINQVYETSGEYDIAVIIDVATMERLNEVIEEIRHLTHTKSTQTRIILKEVK